MENTKKNYFAIIAAFLFFLESVLDIAGQTLDLISAIHDHTFTFSYVTIIGFLASAGLLLFSFGLLRQTRKLCMVGLVIVIITLCENIISNWIIWDWFSFGDICRFLSAVFLLLSVVGSKKSSVMFGALSGALFLYSVYYYVNFACHDFEQVLHEIYIEPFETLLHIQDMDLKGVVKLLTLIALHIFLPIAYVFAGIGLSYMKEDTASAGVPILRGNIIEQLFHLKDLLDKGIITQEEFEKKKKEILEQ